MSNKSVFYFLYNSRYVSVNCFTIWTGPVCQLLGLTIISTQSASETHLHAETYHYKIDRGEQTPCDVYRNTTLYDKHESIVLMTEIQLKNIVERLGKDTVTGTDGDEC
jgi:hypothetical protein